MTEKYSLDEAGEEERINICELVMMTLMLGWQGPGRGCQKLVPGGFFLLTLLGRIASRSRREELLVGGRMSLTQVEK